MASAQLHLINNTEPNWKLDPSTIKIGRAGLAQARAALAAVAEPAEAFSEDLGQLSLLERMAA